MTNTIARDRSDESGAFVLTFEGCTHRLTALEFDAFARQVLREVQIYIADPGFKAARERALCVPCGKLPERSQFSAAFLSLYPHGIFSVADHHSIPPGAHTEAELWAILCREYRAMLSELTDGRTSAARETVALILESVGLKWMHDA